MAAHPSPDRCRSLLDAHGVPPHIRRHSEKVAGLARRLAEALARCPGETVEPARLEAAGLLHDIAKATCFASRADHALEGGKVLRRLGYPAIADLVERHVELGPWDPEGAVTEAELLNYADKRVRHEEVVSLRERFEDLVERYGGWSAEAAERIGRNWRLTEAVEAKIFARLPFGPESLQEWDAAEPAS